MMIASMKFREKSKIHQLFAGYLPEIIYSELEQLSNEQIQDKYNRQVLSNKIVTKVGPNFFINCPTLVITRCISYIVYTYGFTYLINVQM